ncbi:hypothetical protein T492DRAFT_921631 [Pavlovales sp. CCMP2436]|nr:hypothetical protein T492DRAFT_921631 [Pavlovales sp. CCMP2436]
MNQQDIANGKGMAAAEALSSQLRAAYLSQLSAVLSPPSPGHPQGAPDALQRALAFEAAAMAAGAFHATQAGLVQPPTGLPDLPGLMGPPRLPDSSRTFPNFPGLMCPPGLPDLELLPDSSGHPDSSRTFPDFPGLPDPELLPDSFGILPDTSRTPAALVAVNQTVAQQQPQQQPKPQQLQQPQQKQQEALGEQTLGEQTLAQQQQQQQSVEKQKLLQQTQGEPTPRTRTAGKRTLPQQPPILQQTLKMRTLAQGLRAGLENGSEDMQRCFDSEYLPQQQQQQPQQQNNDSQETQEAQQTTNNTSSLIFLHALKNAGSNLLADDKVPRVTSIHTLQRSDSLLTLHKVASALAVAPFAEGELEALFTDALSDASPVDADGFSDDDSSASPPPSPSSDQIEPYTIELDRTPGPPGPVKSTVPKRIPSSNTRMLPQAKRSKTAPAQPRGVWEEGGSGEEDSPGSDEALSGMKAPRQPALRAGESGREVAEFPDSQDVRMEANESGSRFPPGLEGSIWTSRC